MKIKGDNNYAAKVVKLKGLRKHFNADRLQCIVIDGNNVITGLDAKDGAVYVYFPLECAINTNLIASFNGYIDKERNVDKEVAGFFGTQSRVKAVRLRSEPSEGFILPITVVNDFLKSQNINTEITEDDAGREFDTIGDVTICQKYVPLLQPRVKGPSGNGGKAKHKYASKLIDGQFKLHISTPNLKRCINIISPDDEISVTYKMHGTSAVIGKVQCQRPFKWFEKLLKKMGVDINNRYYDLVYSSRRVIKNANLANLTNSYYSQDVWGDIADKYKDSIKNGITLYGEIVGQLPNGKWIQKEYDYGQPIGKSEFFVYRITLTNIDGDVFEFTTPQIETYCNTMGLKMVPIFYVGVAGELFGSVDVDGENWREKFLEELVNIYTDNDCFMCKYKVPSEGIVIRKEKSSDFNAMKLKSFKFLERESKEVDGGEVNIEDDESLGGVSVISEAITTS